METQVTQLHWAQVMGDNPSHFVNGPDSIEMEIRGNKIRMQPGHPVENITGWSALVFANRLSELNGLKPAYDLSGIDFVDTSVVGIKPTLEIDDILQVAAKGSLVPRFESSRPMFIAIEGFRLPTYAEQLYLMSAAGESLGQYYFGNDDNQLKYHAWYKENSEGTTHPVGLLQPMRIRTGIFYDILGNVSEWTFDLYDRKRLEHSSKLSDSSSPVTGGSYLSFSPHFESHVTHRTASNNVGLRLVRTLKPGAQVIERVRTQ
jgi:formylglycine-generating enzyme required for sulfatase activity